MNMSNDYRKAQEKSYRPGEPYILPRENLNKISEIPLGFQPLGICSKGKQLAIAAYFEPAVCLIKLEEVEEGLKFNVEWIRSVFSGGKHIRLFPDLAFSDVNRCQTVFFEGDLLWITRNADKELFGLYCRPGSDRWILADRMALETKKVVQSLYLAEKKIYTIESTLSLTEWELCRYSPERVSLGSLPDFTYGLGRRHSKDLYFVSDFRAKETNIWREASGDVLVIPEIRGNGICFLENGAAIVSRYGQGYASPFNGIPGALVYIPSSYF